MEGIQTLVLQYSISAAAGWRHPVKDVNAPRSDTVTWFCFDFLNCSEIAVNSGNDQR